MKTIIFIMLTMVILSCAAPSALKDVENKSDSTTIDTISNKSNNIDKLDDELQEEDNELPINSTISDTEINISLNESEDEEFIEPEQVPDKIIVRTRNRGQSNEYSDVDGTVNGFNKVFTVPYTDKDAIIFDIAKEFDIKINYARSISYIDDKPYMTPTEQKVFDDTKADVVAVKVDYEDIPIVFTKDDGFIRAVGCDLDNKKLRVRVTNPLDEPVNFFKNVRPTPKAALIFALNQKAMPTLYCQDKDFIAPNETVECVKTNVFFMRNTGFSSINSNATYDISINDTVAVRRPGYQESVMFRCGSDPTIEEVGSNVGLNTTNTTNSTS